MNVQAVRKAIAAMIDDFTDVTWEVTTRTEPDRHHKLIEVGHPIEQGAIRQDTFGTYEVTLPVELWVSEAMDVNTVTDMYALVTPGPGSLQQMFIDAPPSTALAFTGFDAGEAGPRQVGATMFLAATLRITAQIVIDRGE